MTRKKEPRTGDERSMPSRQAQDEVLNSLGAEVDEESGETLVDEKRMHEVGAVDVDAVRENQRRDEYIKQKKVGGKKVPFNTPDVLTRYEMVLTQFPASTLNIFVQRLTGVPAQYIITSRPTSGVELYVAMQKIHGVSDSAEYELKIQDAHQRTWRGTGRITMPDTRDQAAPQQPQPYFAPAVPQAAPVAAPAAAPPAPAPAAGGLDTIALVEQMFNLFQRMTPPAAPPAAAAPAPPTPQQMFAQVAPLLSDPASQVEGIGKLFDLFAKAQAAQATPPGAPPQAVQAPPGMVHVPGVGFVTAEYLAQALAGREPAPQPAPRRPYVPPRREDPRGYDPRDEREERGPNRFGRDSGYEPRYDRGYDPRDRDPRYDPRPRYDDRGPPRERSPISELRTAMSTVREMQELLGAGVGVGGEREPHDAGDPDDEDNPFQVIESGGAKLLADKDTGKVRIMESLAINAPAAFKWIGEQAQAITKAAEQQRAQQQQALPEPARRFVEVIDPPLPPPPDRVPPPISPSGWENSAPEMPFGAPEED